MSQVLEVGFSHADRVGNYRVERELGPTGAGILLQAHHLVLPRKAIIKIVHPAFAGVQQFVLQTLREACILEAIAHPGVPVIYESGVLKDRRPWFAFEAITGSTLEEVLGQGTIAIGDVAGLVRDLADILEHAHRRGVIHRGLRPDRVVVTGDRRYPLCIPDWSEAMAHDATSHLLPSAAAEGSGRYTAPELARMRDGARDAVDDRVDMFALGVIAYRALTGRLPFASVPVVKDAAPHIAARELRPDAPRELTAIIDSLLAMDRFDRPSAAEVRAEVDYLFTALPELQGPRVPIGNGMRTDVVLLEPRLRKPKWTPEVHFSEATDVDIVIAADDERAEP